MFVSRNTPILPIKKNQSQAQPKFKGGVESAILNETSHDKFVRLLKPVWPKENDFYTEVYQKFKSKNVRRFIKKFIMKERNQTHIQYKQNRQPYIASYPKNSNLSNRENCREAKRYHIIRCLRQLIRDEGVSCSKVKRRLDGETDFDTFKKFVNALAGGSSEDATQTATWGCI